MTGFEPVSERICCFRIRAMHRIISIINVHAHREEKTDEDKEELYEQLAQVYSRLPAADIKIVLGDLNAKIGREE